MSKLGNVLSKEKYCNSNVLVTGVWGRSPQLMGDFSEFFEKKAVLTPFDHISVVFGAPFESTRLFNLESQLKKLSCSVFFLLQC